MVEFPINMKSSSYSQGAKIFPNRKNYMHVNKKNTKKNNVFFEGLYVLLRNVLMYSSLLVRT